MLPLTALRPQVLAAPIWSAERRDPVCLHRQQQTCATNGAKEKRDKLGFMTLLLVASMLLAVRPGAPSSVLAPISKARSP